MPRRLLSRLVLWAMLGSAPGGAVAQALTGASYAEPTTRYDHGVLGDAVEWGALRLSRAGAPDLLIRLPQTRVFEDLAPRLVDLGALRVVLHEVLAVDPVEEVHGLLQLQEVPEHELHLF